MSFDPKVIEALAQLRHSAATHTNLPSNVQWAINTLDDAGVFAALDEQTDYASAEEILADSARRDLEKELGYSLTPGTVPPLNPAEWGDTTRADMARHQGTATDPEWTTRKSDAEIEAALRHQGLITEPKGTPLDEPLFDSQAEVYGRLLGGTTGGGKSVVGPCVFGPDDCPYPHKH